MSSKLYEFEHQRYFEKWLRAVGDVDERGHKKLLSFIKDSLNIAQSVGYEGLANEYRALFTQKGLIFD